MNLEDILITPLKKIITVGGDVMHAMKVDDMGYCGFGESYFSWISAGSIKAWKRHTLMTMNIVVPVGQVRFVFSVYNAIRVEEIGINNYSRITVPPGVWFGFQGLGQTSSLILNVANLPHDPKEVERLSINELDYNWTSL
jgi:dTDP-4-dehydrorhamnose 3,5-epimerase